MCGISGIINKNFVEVDHDEIKKINDLIAHRGPDAEGFYHHSNFAFGHRRLSILDLSDLGAQPMTWKSQYTITYNGEVYNYIELRAQLISLGYTFESNSDTEVILAAYDYWGRECVQYFNGMWSFAIFDKKNNIIFCSRDRFGIKPFYFLNDKNKFVFGSEIKQILPFLDKIILEKQIALDYLLSGIEEYNENTFFQGIKKLKGGNNLIYDLKQNTFKIENFYSIHIDEKLFHLDFDKSLEVFKSEFERSIKLRLRSDVKVGTCLSGGLDSSSVSALASELYSNDNEKFIAIHAKSSETNTDESYYAKKVSENSGLDLNIIEPTVEDFKLHISKIIESQEEPFGSPSIFMQFFVFKKARDLNCIVMLDGQGGDETLLGYERYYPALVKSLKGVKKMKALLESSKNSKLSLLQTIKYQYYFSNLKLRLKIVKRRSSFYKKEVLDRYTSDILDKLSSTYSSISDLQEMELTSTQLPHLLRYEDKNSMFHSIESRLPFLDYKLVETSLSLNYNFKIKDGWTKYILRKAIDAILPNEIVWRKNKLGFNAPENSWIKSIEGQMELEVLNSKILEQLIDVSKLSFSKLDKRTKWRLYNFALWEKIFNVNL